MTNSRTRLLAAIRHELPDRVPVAVICIDDPKPVAAHLGIAPEQVPARLGLDGWVVAAWRYSGPAVPGRVAGANEWGATAQNEYGAGHAFPLAAAASVREVEGYPWPDGTAYNFDEMPGALRATGQLYALRGPYWKPVFCQACSLFGMEEALVKMLTEPALFEAALDRITDHVAAYCDCFLKACGDDLAIFCLGDDFASQRGLLMAPDAWRQFIKPRLARLFALGKKYGKPVWFHSCGDISAVIPDLLDIGMDIWETVQLHTLPFGAAELKRRYGRNLCFFGGVSTQRLPFATPDEVRRETLACIEALGQGGGYICGPDHHIKPDVPPANTLALFDTATAFRRPGWTR